MTQITQSSTIEGVHVVHLRPFADARGRFIETFRKSWFPQRSWEIIQTNRSESRAGVLRGLHYHFHQVDYWHVIAGTIRVGLVDLRRTSPTYLASQIIELDAEEPTGVYIPIGVAHGFVALTDATLVYIVDNYYSGEDELGVAWNDPALGLDWGIAEPQVSDRDAQNPLLGDIPADRLP
ncbi:MAG: dTDP-4-dehydrorhamnose 3,5-epimerase [Litorilinea sp.]